MRAKAKQTIKRFLSPSATPGASASRTSLSSMFPSRPTSPIPPTSPNPPVGAGLPSSTNSVSSAAPATENRQEKALEVASSFLTLLSIVEKTLDGLPIWGPKAVIGAAIEIAKVARLKAENDETIKEIQHGAEHVISLTSPSSDARVASTAPIPPELQARIDKFTGDITSHLHELDRYQVSQPLSQPSSLKEKVKTWLRIGSEILVAEAISKALPDVNKRIAASIQNFMLVSQIEIEAILRLVNEKVTLVDEKVAEVHKAQHEMIAHYKATTSYGSHNEDSLLSKLNPVKTAFHTAEGASRTCHEGTRVEVLDHVKTWFHNDDSPSVLWLSGIAGTGKTTIAQSICQILQVHLGASFLFSRDSAERRRPSSILPTIAYQLAYYHPPLRPAICGILTKDPNFASNSVRVQAEELMFKVLASESTSDFPVTLLLFDALDECDKENFQEGGDFIPLLLRFLKTYPSLFKVVITSRPETSIRAMLEGKYGQAHPFVLHEVDKNMVQRDIEAYLRHEFQEIATSRGLVNTWPESVRIEQAKQLAERADRLFIFAATMVKALSSSLRPATMIRSFLKNTTNLTKLPHGSLDAMYLQIVQGVIPSNVDEQEAKDLTDTFQCAVGAIVTLQQPLDFLSLQRLLNVDEELLHAVIGPLFSVLDLDKSLQRPIKAFHLSLSDFLTDNARCADPQFRIVPKTCHSILSYRCICIMNEQLKQDICNIGDPSLLNAEIANLSERLESSTSTELCYACLYWWAHLVYLDSVTEELVPELEAFTSGQLLQWLELLSLMGHLQSAIVGLPKLISWYKNSANLQGHQSEKVQNNTGTLLYDVHRTVQAFFRPISDSALQVYESVLTFMPYCSLLSQSEKMWLKQIKLISARNSQWGQDLSLIEGHKNTVRQIAVSPNGSLLASFSDDKTMRLWDFATGVQLVQIDSWSSYLTFSPDGLQLFSLARELDDLETWDALSGNKANAFHLHLDGKKSGILNECSSQTISPTGNHVAIGFGSGELHIFAITGTTTQLEGHTNKVGAVVFSQDGLHLASCSSDGLICVWDVQTMCCSATTHASESYTISQLCISLDGLQVVSFATRSSDKPCSQVWVWDIGSTQPPVLVLEIPHYLYSSPLSLNSRTIACSIDESGTLATANISSGQYMSVFKGHTREVACTTFTSDGLYVVSGSADGMIRIWDAQLNSAVTASSEGHNGEICDVAISADGTKLFATYSDKTTCCWDPLLVRLTSKIEKEGRRVGFSANNTPVGLYWHGSTIDVWNAETAEDITTLHGHSHGVTDAVFSPDFTRLVSGSHDETVRIWNTATWECTATLTGHTSWVHCVCFSPDGSRAVSGSSDWTVRVWDAGTGDALAVLKGHTYSVYAVRFSSDGLSIVSRDYGENEREWKAGVDFPLSSSPSPLPPIELDDSGWLFATAPSIAHRRRLCWLPAERRGALSFSGLTAVFGSATGVLTILSVTPVAS